MTEKRKFLRFDTVLSVIYSLLEKPSSRAKAYLKNLSREGLKLSGASPLKKGSLVELEMNIPGDNIPIFAYGQVAWANEVDKSNYDAGIKFTKIHTHDRIRLLDYVYEQWINAKRTRTGAKR